MTPVAVVKHVWSNVEVAHKHNTPPLLHHDFYSFLQHLSPDLQASESGFAKESFQQRHGKDDLLLMKGLWLQELCLQPELEDFVTSSYLI